MLEDAAASHLFALDDPSGQTRANVEKLLRLGGRFDSHGAEGASEFARFLRRQEEADAAEGEAVLDASAPVVLMTIHQSKGLEFPVVVLPDLNARVRPGGFGEAIQVGRVRDRAEGVDRWELAATLSVVEGSKRRRRTSITGRRIRERDRDEETAEAKRLLYVGMTRARDRLICVARPPSRASEAPRPLDRAVSWEEWLRRWREEDPSAEREVSVVWQDAPAAPDAGPEPEPRPAPADLVELAGVKSRLAPILPPVVVRVTPHSLARTDERGPDESSDPGDGARLARLRGLLVHACLEDEIHELSPLVTRRIRRALASEGLLAEDTVRRLEVALERHLAGFLRAAPPPLLDPGSTVFREQGFRLALPVKPRGADRADLEGVIDALYLDPERDCWVVLDYKSDAGDPETVASRYAGQLLAYAWAASRILPDVGAGRRRVAAEILMTARGRRVEVLAPLDVVSLDARFRALLRRA
jgi:ATP-dependent exoDNAse (exonuclease V) beta subunit